MDGSLAKALAHPTRVRILAELDAHETLSPVEFATEWNESLALVAYHFQRLHALGFVEIARRTPRRGVIQTHYRVRVIPRSLTSNGPPSIHAATPDTQLRLLMDDLDGAVARGAFDSCSARLSHSRLTLDAAGRRHLAQAITALERRARDIARDSFARLEAAESITRPVMVALLLFDQPGLPEPPVSIPGMRRRRARSR